MPLPYCVWRDANGGGAASNVSPYRPPSQSLDLHQSCTPQHRSHLIDQLLITLSHYQWESLNLGAGRAAASDPSTCDFCIERPSLSAERKPTLTARGAPLASGDVHTRALLHITPARPIVGCPIFRPWPVCGWSCSTSSTLATLADMGMNCGEAIREAGPLHCFRDLCTTSLNFFLTLWLQMSSGRSRRRKTQPRALRWA